MHDLVLTFPDYEKFDLASQIRRASKSIVANVAEGYAKRRSGREFAFFLTNAMGSANEMEVHLQIAHEPGDLATTEQERYAQEYAVIGNQLNRLIAYWRRQPSAGVSSNGNQGSPVSNQRPETSD